MKVKAAVLQYHCPEDDSEAAYKKFQEMVMKAAWMGAQLVVAPETALGDAGEVLKNGTDFTGQIIETAKHNKVFIATSIYKKEGENMFNQGYIISPEGDILLEQKKIYPATMEIKNLNILPGDHVGIAETPIGKLGILICKDGFNKYSHFLYEKLSELGAEIICVPSWSLGFKEMDTRQYVTGMYTYGSYLSRAYILLSGNTNPSTSSYGRSMIVSPVIGIIKMASEDHQEIITQEIDLDEVKKARQFDVWWQPEKSVILK